jgi:hypothetical protein
MENVFNARLETNFLDEQILNLTFGTQKILRILFDSKENGNTIGIRSPLLGEGFFITAVDDIILQEGETTILFKPFDVTGFMLPTNKLLLADIEAACPLISEFRNPFLKNIARDRSWFF